MLRTGRKYPLESALEYAKDASKMTRSTWFVFKVHGGYDYREKGWRMPSDAKIVNSFDTGICTNFTNVI